MGMAKSICIMCTMARIGLMALDGSVVGIIILPSGLQTTMQPILARSGGQAAIAMFRYVQNIVITVITHHPLMEHLPMAPQVLMSGISK